jgi:hypothetical protein
MKEEGKMKRAIILIVIIIALLPRVSLAETILYIKRDTFTTIVGIKTKVNHADDIVNVHLFYKMGTTIPWGTSSSIVSYRYLGVDNNHNLHILRKEKDDFCNLIFELNTENSGEITLIGQRAQKEPLLIKLKVKATNSGIDIQYLGDLPIYQEK